MADAFEPEIEDETNVENNPANEKATLDLVKLKYETDRSAIKNDAKRLAAKLREKTARAVFRYLLAYSFFCALVIILQGFRPWQFSLPISALCFLIGSTAANAISLVAIVLRGLFPPQPKRQVRN